MDGSRRPRRPREPPRRSPPPTATPGTLDGIDVRRGRAGTRGVEELGEPGQLSKRYF